MATRSRSSVRATLRRSLLLDRQNRELGIGSISILQTDDVGLAARSQRNRFGRRG